MTRPMFCSYSVISTGRSSGSAPLGANAAFASPAKAEAVVAAINAAGGRAELFTYDGGHAFMRASDPRAFHPDSAALAFERCTTFFRDTLGA